MEILRDNQQTQPSADRPVASVADSNASRWWVFPLILAVVLVLAVLGRNQLRLLDSQLDGSGASAPRGVAWTPAPIPMGETVALSIDFGNGARREFDSLPWTEGMSVRDAMVAASRFRPSIRFRQRGEAAAAMLTSLEGVANEGATGRNWLYSVDSRQGEVSFAVQPLEPSQRVLWTFRSEE